MKKIILLVMAMILLVSASLAEDLSGLTDDELLILHDLVEKEMANRNLTPDGADRPITDRLQEFMCFWAKNDYTGMLSLCASEWKAKQEDPSLSLYVTIKNRTPMSYEIVSFSGTSADRRLEVAFNTLIDKNTGRDPQMYFIQITMIQEDDGLWYVDPSGLETGEIPEATLVPELTPTPEETAGSITGDTVPVNNPDAALESRLNEFLYFWATKDYPRMLELCASDWKGAQDNPQVSLFAVMKNRTPVSFEFLSVSGEPGDKVRTITTNVLMDKNNGKDPQAYLFEYVMVLENDGLWYVDLTNLATNGMPEATLVPELTSDSPAEITGETNLYYIPDGGTRYHLDPNCKSVSAKLIPLQDSFRYSEVNDPQYQFLKPCPVCGAPERQAGNYNALAPADYTQKAWAFTAENYAELLNNPDSILNQPFCARGMVQEVISEDPLIIVINTTLEEDGEPQPVIIEGSEAGKFHWEKGCEYQIYGDFISVRDGMPVLAARYSFTW